MNDQASLSREDELLQEAGEKGPLGKAAIYTRLSGPGWLQGAITLGGGSLAGALYLGVIMGYQMMWLQPIAMILGVIMLSAISYVTLSTGERPFQTLKTHISPVLAWGWLLATMMANIVWCLPQFALGTAAVQQNLLPSLDNYRRKSCHRGDPSDRRLDHRLVLQLRQQGDQSVRADPQGDGRHRRAVVFRRGLGLDDEGSAELG